MKSQNSSQMNLSGSSSSLTSDASTKTGTVSLRSYGIGGTLLHKRILLMTRQQSRGSSRDRETELEERTEDRMQKETDTIQRGFCSLEQRRGRARQHSNQGTHTDAGQMLLRARAGSPLSTCSGTRPTVHTGSSPSPPGLGLMTLSPPPQAHVMTPKPSVSPIRKRLMSPFRVLRERSQSREKADLNCDCGTGESSSAQDETQAQAQAEQRARRSVSPNPFLWLCSNRHRRRKTV